MALPAGFFQREREKGRGDRGEGRGDRENGKGERGKGGEREREGEGEKGERVERGGKDENRVLSGMKVPLFFPSLVVVEQIPTKACRFCGLQDACV